jgi:hypothetical protein
MLSIIAAARARCATNLGFCLPQRLTQFGKLSKIRRLPVINHDWQSRCEMFRNEIFRPFDALSSMRLYRFFKWQDLFSGLKKTVLGFWCAGIE